MSVGTYYNAGYGNFTLREEPNPENPEETLLVTHRTDMTLRYRLELHHISADYWIVYVSPFGGDSFINDYAKGWFVIGVDGKVEGLNISWQNAEGQQSEGAPWFEKVE